MRTSVAVAIALLCSPAPALADVECRTAAALTRIHNARPLLDEAATSSNPSATLGDLQSDMTRLTGPMISDITKEELSLRERRALSEFAELTNRMALLAQSGDRSTLRALIQSGKTEQIFDGASAAITAIACDAQGERASDQPSAGGSDKSTTRRNRSSQPSALSGLSAQGALIWVLVGAAVGLSVALGLWVRSKRSKLMRRRSQRFPANRRVTVHVGDTSLTGTLLDISALGTKLKHDGLLEVEDRDRITVDMDGRLEPATVVWSNDHYAGLRFDGPLKRTWIRTFVEKTDPKELQPLGLTPKTVR